MPKVIHVDEITDAVEKLCIEANYNLGNDMMHKFREALQTEESPLGCEVFERLIENATIAHEERVPMCQDTGMVVIFVEVGQEVMVTGGALGDALNEGVRRGYEKGYLRKSMVKDPFERVNTGDNTPAIIHYDIVHGDELKITVAPKGAGSENMGALKMCKPSDGLEGAIQFVVDTVERAGGNPCPPIIVGVGIGGTMEKATYLAKKSLLRNVGVPNPEERLAAIEAEILQRVNKLGIGPQGFGGTNTALGVQLEVYPTHIASLPVAVNIQCHAARHKEVVLKGRQEGAL
ncbi:hydro-lyase, Fe-S type, tartrate/fumarate subfamily [Desulfitobacterium dichloroeliminans LMG P-21439]|uniref:Hydro-lyase, Fe-S type, tartrate/fumarate subfamily n=1 Tax=Desulfitobacterium dichloroeliminans (strain LMG P-21439 / DCA1) TaxID=871963 RepID=L0F9N9_DESDL|nr:fumarate hydratase [Desulfitobacterium dichloroeliminans]AGA70509.1 hydro-lyase, Fe-S type, tartrate/fumarate subfamily [Desulfitobacterium dichloroeliminans LMG P-21439]